MAIETTVSVEEYLRGDYVPSCEYVDGVLVPRPMPNWQHALLQIWIGALIMKLYPAYLAGSELHNRLRDREFRIPDIAVDSRSNVELTRYAEKPPYLCVEILSPEDRIGATFAKLERYHDWGVPYCWVVDPEKRRVWTYSKDGEPQEAIESITAGEIRLPLSEIFSILDRATA